MRRMLSVMAGATLLVLAGVSVGEPLSLETLLARSAEHAPKILEAREKVVAQEAKRLSAEGAFDRKVEVGSQSWVTGFYSGRFVDSKIAQPFRNIGGEFYGGYRISGGDFPVYEDEFVTMGLGELNFGASLSLLRDREFDRRRYAIREADLAIEMAQLDQLLASLEVQHDAMVAYWRWAAAGQLLKIYQDLLANAEDRVAGLSVRVNEGDVAQIDIVENTQRILQRRSRVVDATRDLNNAALALSLYNRNEAGEAVVPGNDELLTELPEPETAADAMRTDLPTIINRQAEIAMIDRRLESAANLRRLGENELLPRVDLGVKVARDFGDGSPTRDETDFIIGLEVSVPLERRKARGDIAAAEAEARALTLANQRVVEQLLTNISALTNIIEASRQTAFFAGLEVDQAVRLEEAEWIRFEEGASNFFLLNLREEATADARVRQVAATLAYHRAVADYLAITADAEAFLIQQ